MSDIVEREPKTPEEWRQWHLKALEAEFGPGSYVSVAAPPPPSPPQVREALEPFAEALAGVPDSVSDAAPFARVSNDAKVPGTINIITFGQFRRLVAALSTPTVQAPEGMRDSVGAYKGPMTIDAGLLHALWCYGNLAPVNGVVYSYGAHQKCLDDADKLLFDRAAALAAVEPAREVGRELTPTEDRIVRQALLDSGAPVEIVALPAPVPAGAREDWTMGVKRLLDAIDYTLSVHGKIDADTPLHDRVRKFWSVEGMLSPQPASGTQADDALSESKR